MATVSWKKDSFRISGHPLSDTMFDQWMEGEGRSAMREELRNTSLRWLFGKSRARARLHRTVRTAFRPRGTFCTASIKQLNQLPIVIRSCAATIQRSGHRELCTFDPTAVIVVVPRGAVRNDLRRLLTGSLSGLSQVRAFAGLTERVLGWMTNTAESALFDHVMKGRQIVDDSGRGIILGGDPDFKWDLNGADGHYYYATSLMKGVDLAGGRERRRFVSDIRELFVAQTVHLKRMRPDEARHMADTFRLLQNMETRAHEAPAERARRIRESVPV